MNDLVLKKFEEQDIRIVTDELGDPWFVTQDVMKVLGIKNQGHAIRKLENDQRGCANLNTLGGRQEFSTVSESGLYALIFQSRKPSALRFQNWITREVLPSIRKTGNFITAPPKQLTPLDILENHVLQMRALEAATAEMSEQLKLVSIEAKQENDTLTSDQIKELDAIIADIYSVRKDYKDLSRARKAIKARFGLNGAMTWKEMPRHGFEEAKQMVQNFKQDILRTH